MTTAQAKTNLSTKAPDESTKKKISDAIALYQQMKSERMPWDSLHQEIAYYVNPRNSWITSKTFVPNVQRETQLFDSTAIQANLTLAAGHMTWMTPMESLWFAYEPPVELMKDDDAKGWFHQVTLITAQLMARSNFYTEVHEGYLDRGGFGICGMYVGKGKREALNYRREEVGSYSIANNDEGYVDTFIREFKLTAHQAVQKFGDKNHPKVLKQYREDIKFRNQQLEFIHVTLPRLERDEGKIDSKNKEFMSIYIDVKHEHLIEEGGYDELPYVASRYLKWGDTPYGWSPSWTALPEARQLNYLQKNADLLTELAMFPRFLVPGSLKSRLDLRPGGITYLKDGTGQDGMPKEIGTVADIRTAFERIEQKQEAIRKAFHVDLFQMFAQIERQMTATEVAERASEKLIQFSPTFSRLTTEYYTPILMRTFRICFDAAMYPPPPRSVVQILGNQVLIAQPRCVFSSRVALAMKQIQNVGFLRTLGSLEPAMKTKPDLVDHYNWNAIVRDMARNEQTPEEWILKPEEVMAIQQQRAQQQAQLEQAQIAEQAASAIHKVSSVKPGSPVADALSKQLNTGGLPGVPQQ